MMQQKHLTAQLSRKDTLDQKEKEMNWVLNIVLKKKKKTVSSDKKLTTSCPREGQQLDRRQPCNLEW